MTRNFRNIQKCFFLPFTIFWKTLQMLKSWFYKTNLKDIILFLLSVDVRFDEVCIYILKLAFTFPKTHNTGAEVI